MISGFPWTISNTPSLGNLSNIRVIPKLIMSKTYYIELDVHKDTIAIAYIKLKQRVRN